MSDARTARELVANARTATLATIALRPPGYPYASLVAVAADGAGRPLLLLSSLAEHTKNLAACAKVSLLVTELGASEGDPLAGARVTLLGTIARVPDAEIAGARAAMLAAHPEAAQYASFSDFALYRIEPEELRIVQGFGRMSWIPAAEYAAAAPSRRARRCLRSPGS
jgi:putative heme iron utilization protein